MKDGREKIEEEKLVKRAIRGESSAFGLLYDRYQPAIFRFIYLKVGHREEAEDLTHQTFLSAWQNIESFRREGFSISSWFYRIARNKVIDYYRTKKSTLELNRILEETLASDSTQQAESLSQKMELGLVRKAIQSLSTEQQDVLIMRFVEEMSYREISQVMEKNQGLIRVIQFRALRKIKKIIENGAKDNY